MKAGSILTTPALGLNLSYRSIAGCKRACRAANLLADSVRAKPIPDFGPSVLTIL